MNSKMFRVLTGIIDSTTIRVKLMIIYFILIMLPLGFFTYTTYLKVSDIILTQTLQSASQVFNEGISILVRNFDNMINVSDIITHDTFIHEALSNDPGNYDAKQQFADYNHIIEMLSYLMRSTDIDSVEMYVNDQFYYSGNNKIFLGIRHISGNNWYKILSSNADNRLWLSPSDLTENTNGDMNVFSYAGIIYNVNMLEKVSAVVRVNINKEKVTSVLNNASLTKNSVVYITDGNNIILSSSFGNSSNQTNVHSIPLESIKPGEWSAVKLNNQNLYVNYKPIRSNGWFLVSIVPQKDVTALGYSLINEMLALMLFVAMVSYTLAYLASHSSIKRLSLLITEMRKIEKGCLDVSLKKKGNDEIGELMGAFNKMVTRMSVLVDEQFKMGQEVKNAELKALQAQINPHFLYNSLDLINCIAIKNNITEIVKMVNALAKFYKISLSYGMDIIPIRDEISHITLYIQIQNMRFQNRIAYEININKEIINHTILKMILQPIVENSILHGILEKESKSGIIKVTGKREENTILLLIEDNGIGMSEEKVRSLLLKGKSSNNRGYGIKNTNERIKLYYGSKYGLFYRSELGKGTIAEVRIPLQSSCILQLDEDIS